MERELKRNIRLIARLDIKGKNLIKGIHLEGLRVIGIPNEFALRYYADGADELIFMDSVASLYGRNHLDEIIREAARNVFIPITVGGGVRSVEDAKQLLRVGADKIAINTAAVANPALITQISEEIGSQSLVISIEAKQNAERGWEVYTQNGREKTGIDVVEWASRAVDLGAGELLITSVDREGTRKGLDIELIKVISNQISAPIIVSGGVGNAEDVVNAVNNGFVDAVAMADILHYGRSNLQSIRKVAIASGLNVRRLSNG
jgi:cyclase